MDRDVEESLRAPTDPTRGDGVEEPCPPRVLSTALRIASLVALLFFLAMSLLASGYSLLARPPLPDLTRPLPAPIPRQGALR